MTSSFIPAARSQYLLDLLAQVPDPRKKRGRRHPLAAQTQSVKLGSGTINIFTRHPALVAMTVA